MQNRKLVLPAKTLVVVTLVLAIGIVIHAKRGSSEIKSGPEPIAASTPTNGAEQLSATPKAPAKADPAPAKHVPIPRLVDLGADKCIPCKMMASVLAELKSEYTGKLEVVFVDVWKNPEAGKEYKIDMIPTQVFFDASGKELFRHQGYFSKEDILATWKKLGINLSVAK